jgi:hypothetical protein
MAKDQTPTNLLLSHLFTLGGDVATSGMGHFPLANAVVGGWQIGKQMLHPYFANKAFTQNQSAVKNALGSYLEQPSLFK